MICSTVNVAVRIRPLVPHELEKGSKTCVAVIQGKEKIQVEGSEKSYRFDHVFGPNVNNNSFYETAIRNKVAEVFKDSDVTILAYGQRRSGKTHTMGTNYASEDDMGIIPRAIGTIFEIINSNGAHKYTVTVTFTEFYNKKLYDLLTSNKDGTERTVEIKKHGSNVFDLTETNVTDVTTAMQCFVDGSQKRVTSEKKENSQSTRSHAIFTITIYQREKVDPIITTSSKLHFVDLAGSKHIKKDGKKAHINKDLLAIKNMLNNEQKGKSGSYTKHQSSKFAILLREYLRGNSEVFIIACVSPSSYCLVETLQTLRYANRLRKIKRDFSANQPNPLADKIVTTMDPNSIESEPNLANGLGIQQSTSTMDVQESCESETNDNMKAEWILEAQDLSLCSKTEQRNWLQRELDINTEDTRSILPTQNSDKSGDITYETLEVEVDEDWDASLIRNALKSNEFSTINQEKFQTETDDDIEAQRIHDDENSSKCSIIKQKSFQSKVENDSDAEESILDAQRMFNAQDSSKQSLNNRDPIQREIGNDSPANELIADAQQTLSAQNIKKSSEIRQETFQSKIDDNCEAELIQNAEDPSESSEIYQEKFQRQTDDDIGPWRIRDAQDSSRSNGIQLDFFQTELHDDSQTQTSSETSEIEREESGGKSDDTIKLQRKSDSFFYFQSEMDDDSGTEAIQNSQKLGETSKAEKEKFRKILNDDTDVQKISDDMASSESSISEQEMVESESDENTNAECIYNALALSKSGKHYKKMFQTEMDNATAAERIRKILESSNSSESGQSETDEKANAQSVKKATSKSRKWEWKMIGSRTNDNTGAQRTPDDQEASLSNTFMQEIIKSKKNVANGAHRIQKAFGSNKTTKPATEMVQTKMDEKTDAERIQDALHSNKFSKTKQERVQMEMNDKTTAQTMQNTPKSTKSSKFEHRIEPSETASNTEIIQDVPKPNKSNRTDQKMFQAKMDDITKAEGFQSAPFGKFREAQRENISTENLENSPTYLFAKIADFFLKPSPTEEKDLRKEIRNLRKKLHDRTAKLKTNIMDELSSYERIGLSKTRRENAKLVVAKILEEFQEVLTYIAENSEIRDWMVRVFRRIRDLLDEQKKIAGKMVNSEAVDDNTMDERYAEHTMGQVNRYHELQGVNRCIALLEELVASLPKDSTTIEDILRNLEDTTNQIQELEIEKVDLVAVLKCAEPFNESRVLAEYGIDKVLEKDEKISRLWRRRIKQMIAIERREKFDQQIANMTAQVEKLKSARVRLVEQMKDAEKRWNSENTSGEIKEGQNRARTKKAKNSKVVKCACKLDCLSRRCSCVKNGVSCIDCNCNAESCLNSDKENNPGNAPKDSQTFSQLPSNNDVKCGCATDCSYRRCTCLKNGVICNDNCRCRREFCKNKIKENGTTEANCSELQAPSTSTDGKMEVDRLVRSLNVNSCMCRENGAICTNCHRSFKLREYKAKARRRLFADIDNENEGNKGSQKRPRLGA